MKAKKDVLFMFQLSLVIVGLLMSIYIGMTENYNLQPLMHIILSILLMIIGFREYKRTQSLLGLLGFIAILCISLFILYSVVIGIMIRMQLNITT